MPVCHTTAVGVSCGVEGRHGGLEQRRMVSAMKTSYSSSDGTWRAVGGWWPSDLSFPT